LTHPQPLADLGISRDQSSAWQKLAAVPDPEFEAAWHEEAPTSTSVAAAQKATEARSRLAPWQMGWCVD
jgi:hypothetical protein